MAVLFAVVGAGCSERVPAPTHGDVTFTAEERTHIEDGARFAAEHTGVPFDGIAWDAPHRDDACEPGTIRRAPGLVGALARARCIDVGEEMSDFLVPLYAHEVCHWYGMRHVEAGLMQPLGMRLEWSDDDQAECVRAGLCD